MREVEGKGARERDLCDCINFMISLFVSQERLFSLRFIYDLTFFLIVIVIIFQNLIFGVIIDTFAYLRAEKNRKEEQLKNDCFICGEHYYVHVHVCHHNTVGQEILVLLTNIPLLIVTEK